MRVDDVAGNIGQVQRTLLVDASIGLPLNV